MANHHNSSPTCCQYDNSHGYSPIQYICLQDSCREHRLLCRFCVTEFHSRHKKCVIDKLVSPLDRLCMNSGYQKSQQNYLFFYGLMQSIIQEWQAVTQKISQAQVDITKGFLLQLQMYSKTFTTDQIDNAEKILKNRESDIEVVDNYVTMLKFLEKDYLKDVEGMKTFAQENSRRIKKMIKKVGLKIDIIMKKTIEAMNEADFNSFENVKLQGGEKRLEDLPEQKQEEQEETKMEVEQEDQPKRPFRISSTAPLPAQCYYPAPPSSTQRTTPNRKGMNKNR